jgi:putative DNA primase/helicase
LEGEQNIGKSSALKLLAKNDNWFRDTPFDIKRGDARDAYIKINSTWLYELPEMKSFDKVDANTVKAFISSTTDSYRGFFDKHDKDVPRQCVFVGTTNQKGILHDSTGNVRFWPVHVTSIDFDWLNENVDKLWSAAVCAYQNGEQWHISNDLEHLMNSNREEYEAQDDRITLLEVNYQTQMYDGATITQMLQDIGFMPSQITRRVQMEFGELLTRAHWIQSRERVDGRRQYVWRPRTCQSQ